jgi:ribose transport system substrate-binding protein
MNRQIMVRLLFFALLCLTIFHGSCTKEPFERNAGQSMQIAVIPKGTSNIFWQTVHAGALTAGKEFGVEILWSGPAVETNKEQQVSIVEDFIVRAVDGIVLAPQDAEAMVPSVERIAAANIPLVIMDSGINSDHYVSFAATDNYRGGVEGAREMARRLEQKGQVIIIGNDPGGASTNEREKGFRDTLEKEFPDIQLIGFEYHYNDRGKARAIMDDLLVRNPDTDGVFCSSESSSLGALLALQASKTTDRLVFIAFDSSPELVKALENGEIHAIINQDPFRIGYEGVKTLVRHLRGEAVEQKVDTGVFVVTKENMNEPEIEILLNPNLDSL